MYFSEIESIEEFGCDETYDIWNYDPLCQDIDGGNFIIDGVLVHNSIPEAVKNRSDTRGAWKKRLSDIHPILLEILHDTYGIILWQEQLAAIWQRLGGFTSPEAQDARKAVAKKWVHKLKPIGEKWLVGAAPMIGRVNAEKLWESMVTFGRYAFNKCLDKDTILEDCVTGERATVAEWFQRDKLPDLLSWLDGAVVADKCVAIHDSGLNEVFEIIFDNGQRECVTMDHKFLCSDGEYYEVREIIDKGLDIVEIGTGEL
jgi:Bacterial DNA polymerase III alpha subunit finger domain